MAYNAWWKCLWIHRATSPWPSHLVQLPKLHVTRNPLRHSRLVNWHIRSSALLHELLREFKFSGFSNNFCRLDELPAMNAQTKVRSRYNGFRPATTTPQLRRRSETVLTKIITNCSKVLTNHAQNIFGWRAEYVNSAEKGVTEAAMPIHRTPNTFILSYLICIPWVCHQISNSPYLNIHFNWLICRQSMHPGNHIGNVMWSVVQWRHTGFMWSNKLCILLDGAKSEKSNWTSMWNWYDCHLFTYTFMSK